MPGVNQFLAFATSGGANVVDQATYAAASYVANGRSSGILPSNVYNKIARQGAWGSAALGQFIVNQLGVDALDNGDLTAFVANLTAAIIASSSNNFSTGDGKLTLKTAAEAGWIMMNDGTIGDASSGGTSRASADCQALFVLIWNNVSNTYAPVPSGRGGSALADWNAHKTITLTRQLGRAIMIAGAGSGLTVRALGQFLGQESVNLIAGQNAPHNHGLNDPGHQHGVIFQFSTSTGTGFATNSIFSSGQLGFTQASTTGITLSPQGNGDAHENMPPVAGWNIEIKL